ncbi:hypothetical protein SNE40_013657 [Patella caerulea]|uniref:Uncharacterized protein n=1 Tax=Patella caerulea TaxID=87958 RepID=A0AAN8JDX3_PATCE
MSSNYITLVHVTELKMWIRISILVMMLTSVYTLNQFVVDEDAVNQPVDIDTVYQLIDNDTVYQPIDDAVLPPMQGTKWLIDLLCIYYQMNGTYPIPSYCYRKQQIQ